MTRMALLVGLLLASLAASLPAQTLRFVSNPPDCSLAKQRLDNPFSTQGGWHMRRYQWHISYAALTGATAWGIHKVTGKTFKPIVSATAATLAVGLVPHVHGGLIKRSYPIDLRDWTADLVMRGGPVWYATAHGPHSTKKEYALAAAGYLAAYFAVACYASP